MGPRGRDLAKCGERGTGVFYFCFQSHGPDLRGQALFYAQGKLLADATQEVSNLETRRKENQHKIDRLRDYERQIEQHLKVQKLWCVWVQ